MAMTRFQGGLPSASNNKQIVSGSQLLADPGATEWVKFVDCDIAVALSGTATTVVATVERSSTDPAGTANIAPADNTGFTGDLTAGLAAPEPNIYTEPGVGWWRVNVGTLTAGNVTVSMTGIGG